MLPSEQRIVEAELSRDQDMVSYGQKQTYSNECVKRI